MLFTAGRKSLLLVLQQVGETGEWFVRGWLPVAAGPGCAEGLFIKILLVFIIVAVEAEELPVAPVRRIVVVIVVLVMDREFAKFFARKFPAAPRADMGVHPERLLPVLLLPELAIAPGLGYDLVLLTVL